MTNISWYLDPNRHCVGTDPEVWMPNKGVSFGGERLRLLRGICRGCPVRAECFKDALSNCEIGFQAGYTASGLRGMRKQHGATARTKKLSPCGTDAAYIRHRRKGEKPCVACTQAHSSRVALDREKRQNNG